MIVITDTASCSNKPGAVIVGNCGHSIGRALVSVSNDEMTWTSSCGCACPSGVYIVTYSMNMTAVYSTERELKGYL